MLVDGDCVVPPQKSTMLYALNASLTPGRSAFFIPPLTQASASSSSAVIVRFHGCCKQNHVTAERARQCVRSLSLSAPCRLRRAAQCAPADFSRPAFAPVAPSPLASSASPPPGVAGASAV